MSISYVGYTGTAVVDTASFNFALPTCLEDDIVVILQGSTRNSDIALEVTTSGYTKVADIFVYDLYGTNFSVSWKRMGSTPDTSVTCTGDSGNAARGTTAIAYVLRGADGVTPMDVAVVTATGANTAVPDCGAITPVSDNSWVLACGCGADDATSVTHPSGYSDGVSQTPLASNPATVVACWKQWSGSGAEDPAAWGGFTTSTDRSWGAVTLAIREGDIEPPTGVLSLAGSVPATAVAPTTAAITLTGQTPVANTAMATYPSSGAITLTGQTPVANTAVATAPPTGQVLLAGQTPTVLVHILADLGVTLPAITSLFTSGAGLVVELPPIEAAFTAEGAFASLQITMPAIEFEGTLSSPALLDMDMPVPELMFYAGNGLTLEMPVPEVAFTAQMGATCSLEVDLPVYTFAAQSGAKLSTSLPVPDVAFTALTGAVATLDINLPPVTALFEAQVETIASLNIDLPWPQIALTSEQENLAALSIELPVVTALLEAKVGSLATLAITMPMHEVLITTFEDISAGLYVTMPIHSVFFEASNGGRFDSSTATELEATVLKWRRPS